MPPGDHLRVETLVEQIRALLAGNSPEVQGAALADLLAIWLAGHIAQGDTAATNALREELLYNHLAVVRRLVPINAFAIHGT